MAERDQKFSALLADPVWIKARDESERNGPLTTAVAETFFEPVPFPAA